MARAADLLNDPKRPKMAPPEYAGMWVAWTRDHQEIVAHGRTLEEAIKAVSRTGYHDPIYQRVRRLDEIRI